MVRAFQLFALGACVLAQIGFASASPRGSYKNIVDKFTALQKQYPQFSSTFDIGENDDGEAIFALRISTTPQTSDPKKVGHIVVATHHGNEGVCAPFAFNFATEMLKRYSSNELYRGNLAETEWTIIPVLNISGYNNNDRYEHGNDPNRDYPGICNSNPGGELKSIRQLMEHLKSRVYTGSLTVHGYAGAMTYPWGVDAADTHTLDHNIFESITAKAAAINGYRYGTSTDMVYPANNTYEDFVYWKYGMWSLLLEFKSDSTSDIQSTTKATMAYFDQLDASPSVKNQFTSHCVGHRPDPRLE